MLYLTCTMISSVHLAHYGVSCAKDRVSMDCGTISDVAVCYFISSFFFFFLPPSRSGGVRFPSKNLLLLIQMFCSSRSNFYP